MNTGEAKIVEIETETEMKRAHCHSVCMALSSRRKGESVFTLIREIIQGTLSMPIVTRKDSLK